MDAAQLTKVAIGLGIALAVAKFVSNSAVKAAAYGVAGIIVAKQIPFVKDAI
jgi:hypothetical protein